LPFKKLRLFEEKPKIGEPSEPTLTRSETPEVTPAEETQPNIIAEVSKDPLSGWRKILLNGDADPPQRQTTMPFPSAEAKDDVSTTSATDTTERTITVSLPTGASIVRAMLAAFVTIINRTANAQDIDIDVKGRPSGGSWTTFFSQTDIISLPAVDKAPTGDVYLQDVSSLVTGAGTYGFKLTVTLSSANTVRFKTQFLLVITYKMS
jgi:hypothetical protein